jgi:hypothetical protein
MLGWFWTFWFSIFKISSIRLEKLGQRNFGENPLSVTNRLFLITKGTNFSRFRLLVLAFISVSRDLSLFLCFVLANIYESLRFSLFMMCWSDCYRFLGVKICILFNLVWFY